MTQAGGQLPAVISNQRSPLVGVGASKNAAENREKQRTLLQIRSHPKLEFYVSIFWKAPGMGQAHQGLELCNVSRNVDL